MNKYSIAAVAVTTALALSSCGSDDDVIADCTDDASAEAYVLIYGNEGDHERIAGLFEDNAEAIAESDDDDEPFTYTWSDVIYSDIDGGNFLDDGPSTYHDGDTFVISGAFQQDDDGELSLFSKTVGAVMNCVLDGIDTPPAIRAQIEQTSAMDGMQNAEFDGVSLFWNYHPDDGMFMTIDQ